MAKSNKKDKKEEKKWIGHICKECKHVTPRTEPEKLSVKGEPILGKCPHWTDSNSVLLSWPACEKFD